MTPILNDAIVIAAYTHQQRAALGALIDAVEWGAALTLSVQAGADHALTAPQEFLALAVMQPAAPATTLVACILARHHRWNNLSQVQTLAVLPDFQRRGVASALMRRAEEWAQANGARGVYLDTPTTNPEACAFYAALGYDWAYIMPRYYNDEEDGVTFQKFFTPDLRATTA